MVPSANDSQTPTMDAAATSRETSEPNSEWIGADATAELIRRSRAAIAGLWAVGIANGIALVVGVCFSLDLQSLEPTALIDQLETSGWKTAYHLCGLAKTLTLVTAGVLFLHWFYLLYQNLIHLSDRQPKYDPRWTIWGFIVPVINLFRPKEMMREVWEITSTKWDEEPALVSGRQLPTDWVNLWWGMFLAMSCFANLVNMAASRATTVHQTLRTTWGTLFTDCFGIAALLVAVAVVRNVTRLQSPLLQTAMPQSSGLQDSGLQDSGLQSPEFANRPNTAGGGEADA